MDVYKIHSIDRGVVSDYVNNHTPIDPLHIAEESRGNLLRTACNLGDTELVRKCIDIGVDCIDPKLLEFAAYYGHTDIVKLLLDNGSDPTWNDCWSMRISHIRSNYETSNLIKQYLRRYKINQLLNEK